MTAGADGAGLSHWLAQTADAPGSLPDAGYIALLGAEGAELEALAQIADGVRRARVGDEITFAVNRNLETAAVAGDPDLLAELLDEAWALGATEVCLQGPLPTDAPMNGYLDLITAIREQQAEIHLHGLRAAEVLDGARRLDVSVTEFLARARSAGLGSVPGTGALILDDPIRAALTGGGAIAVREWIEVITCAHRVGLASTATMVYGHLETPAQQVAHLRTLAGLQARTGGFSEMILMPIQPAQVPAALDGQVRGANARETRALHAVARLLLDGEIDHLQAPWPKVGLGLSGDLLNGGADDIGGILLDGRRDPGAGPEAGTSLSLADVRSLGAELGRGVRQRTTLYGRPSAERLAVTRDAAIGAVPE